MTAKPELYCAPQTPAEYVDALEKCGGNLQTFCALHCPGDNHQRWLFEIGLLVTDDQLRKRWRLALDTSLQTRLDYMQSKVLGKLETVDNLSTGDISLARLILEEPLVYRAERAKKMVGFPFAKALARIRATTMAGVVAPDEADEDDDASIDAALKEAV